MAHMDFTMNYNKQTIISDVCLSKYVDLSTPITMIHRKIGDNKGVIVFYKVLLNVPYAVKRLYFIEFSQITVICY